MNRLQGYTVGTDKDANKRKICTEEYLNRPKECGYRQEENMLGGGGGIEVQTRENCVLRNMRKGIRIKE